MSKKINELVAACKEDRVDVVQELLEKFEPSQRDNKGWSPLHYASQYGHKKIVKLLLQRGCLPQIETRDRKDTPLHLAGVNGHEDVVRCLLEALPAGERLRKNREGNNPLHLACKVGNASIVNVLWEYSPIAAYEANSRGVTPFGFALSNSHWEIANLLLEHANGNPADRFKDFATQFPSFDPKYSLDFPVKVFVVGDHLSGKSTLIKSLQVEGILDRFLGIALSVQDVDQHKAGLVPSDFSSRSFGRVIFYDLASGPDFFREDMIQSADDIMHSAFIICINLKEERKEMESRMLYWMNFIYSQCESYCSSQNKPNVTVVGTFSEVVKPFRLVNPQRLHLSYNSVIASHPQLSSCFNLMRKYCILDCRKSETPSMNLLRSALKRLCQRLRPTKTVEIPSRCYILSSVLASEIESASPIQLWELAAKISSTASKDKTTLCKLLPQKTEELLPLCQQLQLRDRVTLLNPRGGDVHSVQSMWIIHKSHRLITMIDNALSAAKEVSEGSSSLALVEGESLHACFSSISLNFDLLLQLLEHFKVYDKALKVASEDDQMFYFPSLLPRKHPPQSWDPKDSSFSFQFAWALVPTPSQECQFFMPRFLKMLHLTLLSADAGYNFTDWSDGIYCCHDEIEYCLMVKREAIILSMRCEPDREVPCLLHRNQILKGIRALRESIQPATKTNEYAISMEGKHFPLKKLNLAQVSLPITDMKNTVMSTGRLDPKTQEMLFIEPYVYLTQLSEPYRRLLSDPENASKPVSSEFMAAIAKCFGEKWQNVMEHLDLARDTSTQGSHSHSSDDSLDKDYGDLLEKFSSISIFEASDLRRALQDPEADLIPDFQRVQSPEDSSGTPTTVSPQKQQSSDGGKKSLSSRSSSDAYLSGTPEQSSASSGKTYPEPMIGELPVHAYIKPKRHKFLCQVPCVDMIKVFQCDPRGGEYHSESHDIEVCIPEGAVSDNVTVHLEIGVTLHGPFDFPNDMKPISPIVWLGVQEGIAFNKSVELTLPHFINYTDEISQNVCFLATEVRRGNGKFHFQKIRNPGISVIADTGTLRTRLSKHPRFVCIAAKAKVMISRTNYCLIEAVPRPITQHVWNVHFCVTYMLRTCTEIAIRQLAKDGYHPESINIRVFNFKDTGNPNPAIEVHFNWKQQGNWFLTGKTSKEIQAHDIEFDQAQLRNKIWYGFYPPRFTIEVHGENADSDSCAEISFTGMKKRMKMQLHLPKLSLARSQSGIGTRKDSDSDLDYYHYMWSHRNSRTQSVWSIGSSSIGSGHSRMSLLSHNSESAGGIL